MPPKIGVKHHENEPSSRSAGDAVPIPTAIESCAEAARRRLEYAGLLVAPGAVALFLRRRRLDPPTNPNPNLAT